MNCSFFLRYSLSDAMQDKNDEHPTEREKNCIQQATDTTNETTMIASQDTQTLNADANAVTDMQVVNNTTMEDANAMTNSQAANDTSPQLENKERTAINKEGTVEDTEHATDHTISNCSENRSENLDDQHTADASNIETGMLRPKSVFLSANFSCRCRKGTRM